MYYTLQDTETGEIYEVPKEFRFIDLAKQYEKEKNKKVLYVKFNNDIKELFEKIEKDGFIQFCDITTNDGVRIYRRGLFFVFYIALKEINPDDKLYVNNTLNDAIYCELKSGIPTEEYLQLIENKMKEIVEKDYVFVKKTVDKFDAIEMFSNNGDEDKALLFKYRKKSTVNIYYVDKYFNYFYGYLPYSTGYLQKFKLHKVENGFVILHPTENQPDEIPTYKHSPKLFYTFEEYKNWLNIMEIETVGELNLLISQGSDKVRELIRISEALHEKKYAEIADEIVKRKKIRLITIAGPSSSGKTTSAKRIALHLKVHGLRPISISLDDFFLERDKTPRDEFGNYDFESINALDLDLFNKTMNDLIDGKEVMMPKFDFTSGRRTWYPKPLKIEKDQPIIIEGIHGLNEVLTSSIPRETKFKIYISSLTQMNLDSMNRIPTTDTRLIRRLVRDNHSRGYTAESTLKMWPAVVKGEQRNIFPFQEEADIMFNSHLVYELAVLKMFAEPLLLNIDNTVDEYTEAKRLLRFLDYFLPITEMEEIPRTSIIREFIGNSTFKY
ncbi:MAG: nucleoside kinase [Defluviitoga tunisiensis]|jgi:uridine kinase|nr:nucleoside kinase [Defluviitoga tunisiensis]MDY0379461.1 nucleoside kinase [Defluviitoga tunisiensis]HHV01466.1 nucleoside kinase [Defluviitoga tunisiensis]HOB55035.1 nucleoside kinase [Defluviitoga tunisiensis]HOK15715.1 nucleoside kinase [Defluviitoga tunisiensis]